MPRFSIVAGDGIITGDNDDHRLHQSSGGGFSAAAVANGEATVDVEEGGQEVVFDELITSSSTSPVVLFR